MDTETTQTETQPETTETQTETEMTVGEALGADLQEEETELEDKPEDNDSSEDSAEDSDSDDAGDDSGDTQPYTREQFEALQRQVEDAERRAEAAMKLYEHDKGKTEQKAPENPPATPFDDYVAQQPEKDQQILKALAPAFEKFAEQMGYVRQGDMRDLREAVNRTQQDRVHAEVDTQLQEAQKSVREEYGLDEQQWGEVYAHAQEVFRSDPEKFASWDIDVFLNKAAISWQKAAKKKEAEAELKAQQAKDKRKQQARLSSGARQVPNPVSPMNSEGQSYEDELQAAMEKDGIS